MRASETEKGNEDRDRSFKRQAIDSLAHCSPREHTLAIRRMYGPLVVVIYTFSRKEKVKEPGEKRDEAEDR